MAKKLFAFWSDERQYHFFALVHADRPDVEVKALAMAATSDANREDDVNTENGSDGCDDGLCVEESIKARLTPLGFEFIDAPVGFGLWEEHRQDETLLEAQLRVKGIAFERGEQGNLKIHSPDGEISADVVNGMWTGQGSSGSIKTADGVHNLIFLILCRLEKHQAA